MMIHQLILGYLFDKLNMKDWRCVLSCENPLEREPLSTASDLLSEYLWKFYQNKCQARVEVTYAFSSNKKLLNKYPMVI